MANQRGELLVFDQSNINLGHTNQSSRPTDKETMSDEMDLDQTAPAVQGAMQLLPRGPADKSQLSEESRHCAQFAEDLRVKLILGNMVRALLYTLNII